MTRGAEPRERGGPYLTVITNHREVQRRPLTGTTTVGRSLECDLWLEDAILSRRHCMIEEALEGDGWVVIDLQSRNGVFVNAKRVEERSPLNHGDVITVGRTHLKFHAHGYVPTRPQSPEEALRMPANRAAMKMPGLSGSGRPLPTPRVANADTMSPGDTQAGPNGSGMPSPVAPAAPGEARPLPFTRPPARPIVRPVEEDEPH